MGFWSRVVGLFIEETSLKAGAKTVTKSTLRPAGKVAVGTLATGTLAAGGYGLKKWGEYTEKERNTALDDSAFAGVRPSEREKLATVFTDEARGDISDLPAAFKEFTEKGGKKEEIDKWRASAKVWVAKKNKQKDQSWFQNALEDIQDYVRDPKSFGGGSLIGAIGLGALGGWFGGAWLAIPLVFIGGMIGQKLIPIASTASNTNAGTPPTQRGTAANTPPAPSTQPVVVVPTTPNVSKPPLAQGQKPSTAPIV